MWPTRAGVACLALWVGDAAVPRTRDVRGTWRLEHCIHNHNVALSRTPPGRVHPPSNIRIRDPQNTYFFARWSTHGVGACVTEAP